jgi:hypothetical protein
VSETLAPGDPPRSAQSPASDGLIRFVAKAPGQARAIWTFVRADRAAITLRAFDSTQPNWRHLEQKVRSRARWIGVSRRSPFVAVSNSAAFSMPCRGQGRPVAAPVDDSVCTETTRFNKDGPLSY